jgi:hypothetical protein
MFINLSKQQRVDEVGAMTAVLNGDVIINSGGAVFETGAELGVALKQDALQLIDEKHAEMLTAATGGATAAERDTWLLQEAAALGVLAGGDGGGVLRPKRGETLHELAVKIVGEDGNGGKSADYKRLIGIANEIKRNAEQDVEALTLETLEDLQALDAVLADAAATASAALAQINNP